MLILLICACPVYHCVICIYAIRSSDRNIPINPCLLTYLHNTGVPVGKKLKTKKKGVMTVIRRCNSQRNDVCVFTAPSENSQARWRAVMSCGKPVTGHQSRRGARRHKTHGRRSSRVPWTVSAENEIHAERSRRPSPPHGERTGWSWLVRHNYSWLCALR